jgi:hypothetical protein
VSNSYSTCTVDGEKWVGGFMGYSDDDGSATSCYATGTVSGDEIVGGFVGANGSPDSVASASLCYAAGNVSGSGNFIGGFAGNNGTEGSIVSCYAKGAVSGHDEIGGLVGYNYGQIIRSYSVGKPTGHSFVGGLCGVRNSGSVLTGNFWDTQTSEKSAGTGSGSSSGATGKTTVKMKTQSTFTAAGWDFVGETANGTDDIWTMDEGVSYPKLTSAADDGNDPEVENLLAITKCTVTASSKDDSDKISFSGTMNANADNFNDANTIKVAIDSNDSNDINDICVLNFPKNSSTFKNGKYKYSGTAGIVRKSFAYNPDTGKFSFAASNVDLLGLGCPVSVGIEIGDFNAVDDLDETIVNGTKVPIPILLMMGVKDVLMVGVDKCTVKQNNKKLDSDQLTVKGSFAVEDAEMSMANRVSEDLVITLDTQHFTIPKENLKPGNGKFTCSKVNVTEVGGGIASATFNFNLCAFILTIKNANIQAISGDVYFRVAFADYNEVVQVTLP